MLKEHIHLQCIHVSTITVYLKTISTKSKHLKEVNRGLMSYS